MRTDLLIHPTVPSRNSARCCWPRWRRSSSLRCAWSRRGVWARLAQAAIFIAGPAALWVGLQRGPVFGPRLDAWMGVAVTGWLLLPCIWEAVSRQLGAGDAPEIIMLACLQNAALMLAAFSHRRRCQQTSVLLASFLVLFALVMGSAWAVFLLAGLYGVLVLWWLMARYWDKVSHARAAVNIQRCLPVRSSVLVGTCLVVLAAGAALGGVGGTTYVLRGFLPTSGGDRWNDPFARAGVGDGDAMVAAQEDAMSFGPVESELFLESQMPTLYDMFNEQYGDPPKLKKKNERAIALDSGNVKHAHQRIAKTQRSGREFSTLRKRGELQRKPLGDRDAPAMLYLVGETPAHLALETFDTFDGTVWKPTRRRAPPPRSLRVKHEGDKPWIDVGLSSGWPILRTSQTHAVKFINLKSNRVPAPPLLAALHIDRLDQADFFGWTADGLIEMTGREQVPQFTVVHLRSSGMNLQALRERDFTAGFTSAGLPRPAASLGQTRRCVTRAGGLPAGPKNSHGRETAAEWTRGVPRGWQQVEAVVGRLRSEFQVDRDARAPEDCPDAADWFLRARRGPDYLFATTAAVMLRSLGYPTRLVTGFYARPERFDRRAGQTAVLADDVHVWGEVCIDGRTWIPIEADAGLRAAPRVALTWGEWASAAVRGAAAGPSAMPPGWPCCWPLAVVGWFQRLAVLDALGYAAWRLVAAGSAERQVRWTIRLLEWRGWCCGRPRPREATLSDWYGRVAASLPPRRRKRCSGSCARPSGPCTRRRRGPAAAARSRPGHRVAAEWPARSRAGG
jgi:protein-glutamine gamma-glutamyltransferase